MSFSMISSMGNFLPKKAVAAGGVSITGQWVAVGDGGVIAKSTDGNVWTPAATSTDGTKGGLTSVGYGVTYGKDNLGAGLWVAVGGGGLIAKSTDGNVWTPAATKGGITNGHGVAYGKDNLGAGLWVAVGQGGIIAKSTDGNTWTPAATSTYGNVGGITTPGYGVAYGKDNLGAGLWVAVGGGGLIAKSTDGNVWTPAATKGGITDYGLGVAYGKDNLGAGLWVAVGYGGLIAKSTDGNTWTPAATVSGVLGKGGITSTGRGVAYGKDASGAGLWVAVGQGEVIAKSTDGNVWTTAATSTYSNVGGITTYGLGVAYGKDNLGAGLWVAVGQGGIIAKSTDGNVWTPAAGLAANKGGITNNGRGVAFNRILSEEETNYSFTISPAVDSSSVTILGLNYKVYTFTNTTANYYTITKTGPSSATIYYMCVGAGGSGYVGGGGGGQFREGSIYVVSPQTMTLSVGGGGAAGNRGSSSTMVFSVETGKNITSLGGFAGTTSLGGTSGDGLFAGGSTSSYGGGGGGAGGAGQNGSASGGGDGGLPKKTAVAGISAVYPNTWWAAGGPGGYVAGNSYAGAGSGEYAYAPGKGISTIYPGYNTTIIHIPNARNNTGSGGGSSQVQNTGGSGIIVLALPA
jgi:hypothetical protein